MHRGTLIGNRDGPIVTVRTYCQGRLLQVCVLRPVQMAENTVLQELLDKAFYVRHRDDKLKIKNKE